MFNSSSTTMSTLVITYTCITVNALTFGTLARLPRKLDKQVDPDQIALHEAGGGVTGGPDLPCPI